jgi:hypothetical protein
MGVNPDLRQAAKDSLRAMIEHISTTYHLEPVEAYVLASLVVDLKISEIVDKSRTSSSPPTCHWGSSGSGRGDSEDNARLSTTRQGSGYG